MTDNFEKKEAQAIKTRFAIILRGPCGAGKTTIARELKKCLKNTELIEVDRIKDKFAEDSNAPGDSRTVWFIEAGRQANHSLNKGRNVIIEEAFSFPHLFQSMKDEINQNVDLIIVQVKYSLEEHLKRNREKEKVIHSDDEACIHYRDYIDNGSGISNDLSISDSSLDNDEVVNKIINYIKKDKSAESGSSH